MSINQMLLAMKAKVGSPARKLVLIKLADNANDNGVCFPSYQHIADHCEVSKRSVIIHINNLEKDGFLIKEHRKTTKGNTSNTYTLSIAKGGEESAPPLVKNLHHPSEESAPPPSEESAPRTSHSFEPVIEPKEKIKEKPISKNEKLIPCEQEVSSFALQAGLNLDGFYDYYESNGWMVGKNKMVKWKSAARGWSRRNAKNNGLTGKQNTAAMFHDTLKQIASETDEREMGECVV